MSWVMVLLLAIACFAVAALFLKLPKAGYAMFGAALMLGLAGYALQGSPGQDGSPTAPTSSAPAPGGPIVDARRALFDPTFQPAPFVMMSDGYARRGQYQQAAELLRGAVEQNPNDTEAWLALGNALVEHSSGQLTPAALYAYSRAEATAPGHPGPSYFLGVSLIRSGRPGEARALWAEALAAAPEDAPWRESLENRLGQLDAMLASAGGPQG